MINHIGIDLRPQLSGLTEYWLDIPGLDNYQASNFGRIKEKEDAEYYEHIYSFKSKGYHKIKIKIRGGTKVLLVHRLVAQTFLPNPHDKEVVNHMNEKVSDNRLVNLEWATYRENSLCSIYNLYSVNELAKVS